MEQNLFFRWIWRFNALVIALAATTALGLGLFGAYKLFHKDVERTIEQVAASGVKADADEVPLSFFAGASRIGGSSFLRLPFGSSRKQYSDPKGGGYNYWKNYLYVNIETGATRWLLPHLDFSIRVKTLYSTDRQTPLVEMIVRSKETRGEVARSESRQFDIAVARIDGSGYHTLVEDVTKVLESFVTEEKQVIIVYDKDGKTHLLRMASENFVALHKVPLPNFQKEAPN